MAVAAGYRTGTCDHPHRISRQRFEHPAALHTAHVGLACTKDAFSKRAELYFLVMMGTFILSMLSVD